MPNLITYNQGTKIQNALQFGTIAMIVNGDATINNYYNWCPDNGICNQYNVISDSYTLGLSIQSTAIPLGYLTQNKTDASLISVINNMAAKIGGGGFTTLTDAINYAISKGFFIKNQEYPAITTDGSYLILDAGFTASYPNVGSTWYDLSFSANNATLISSPTWTISGINGYFTFDGSSQYANAGSILSSSYTKMCWFYVNNLSNQNNLVSGNISGFGLNGGNKVQAGSNGTYNKLSSTTTITTGQWYFAAVSFATDSQVWKLYINGVLESTYTDTTGETPGDAVYIGARNSSNFFNGRIGYVSVHNSALTDSQILQTYNALLPRYNGTYSDPCPTVTSCAITQSSFDCNLVSQISYEPVVTTALIDCLDNVQIIVSYTTEGHHCNCATFKLLANGVNLGNAYLSNTGGSNDQFNYPPGGSALTTPSYRYNLFNITGQTAIDIANLSTDNTITLSMLCNLPAGSLDGPYKLCTDIFGGGGCHTNTNFTQVYKNGSKVWEGYPTNNFVKLDLCRLLQQDTVVDYAWNVRVSVGTDPGPYSIYYNAINTANYATIYGTSTKASNVTLADLKSAIGVYVTIPNNSSGVILANNNSTYNLYCPNSVGSVVLPTPTQLYTYLQVCGGSSSSNVGWISGGYNYGNFFYQSSTNTCYFTAGTTYSPVGSEITGVVLGGCVCP